MDVSLLQHKDGSELTQITKGELKEFQISDDVVGPVYQCVLEKRKPTKEELKGWSQKSKVMLHQFKKLSIENGLLVRQMKKRKQLVLPEHYHSLVYRELHEKLGHLGSDKVEELARQRFYWPYMQADIESYIQNRCACLASKRPNIPERAPLVPVAASAPFELVCIDFLHLDRYQGHEYVLLVTDHFSRFTQAFATKDKSSKSAAQKLFNEYIPKFGFPLRIHHDQGKEFNSSLFKELHRLAGIKMSNTTPYHAMGNGEVERMNRTLVNMLKTLPETQKKRWKEHLSSLTFAYNSTVNKTTGYSPFYLCFGRESRLPLDCILPIEPNTTSRKTYDQFVREWRASMRDAFQAANQNIERAGAANKRRYDASSKAVSITVGDRVLVRNVGERGGTGKLRSWWEQMIYVVTEVNDVVPVFTIGPLDGKKTKTVHRNMLMRVNDMPLDTFGQVAVKVDKPKVAGRKKPKFRKRSRTDVVSRSVSSSSNSDSDVFVVVEKKRSGAAIDPSVAAPSVCSSSQSDPEVVSDEGVMMDDRAEESTDPEVDHQNGENVDDLVQEAEHFSEDALRDISLPLLEEVANGEVAFEQPVNFSGQLLETEVLESDGADQEQWVVRDPVENGEFVVDNEVPVVDRYAIPPEMLAQYLEPTLKNSDVANTPFHDTGDGSSSGVETVMDETLDSFERTSDSFKISGEEDTVDTDIDNLEVVETIAESVCESGPDAEGEEIADDDLEETIPYGEDTDIDGSSEYATANESPSTEGESNLRRYPKRIRTRKAVLTYGSNFEPKIKRFDMIAILNE